VQEAEILSQLLCADIANSGKYAVLPRLKTIETLMDTENLKRANLTDPANITSIGALTGADYVLAGNIISQGANGNILLARILSVDNSSLQAGGDIEYKILSDGYKLVEDLSYRLTGVKAGPGGISVPSNMVYVEGGAFQMGSNNGAADEKPVHRVALKGFYLGKTEVTQKDYVLIMGNNPSYIKGDNLPVESVSWFEAVEYCNKLSLREGLNPAYSGSGADIICDFNASGYRLPTEAEWEFAAKGGGRDTMVYEYSGGNSPDSIGWYKGNSGDKSREAGTKAPNSLGLFDMSGNVWEWCWDWYGVYTARAQTDPRGPGPGAERVFRGGSWEVEPPFLRSAARMKGMPLRQYRNTGFRIARPAL
jgi:formylglycine-generating enzyme required for sulfatase activity